MNNILVIIVSLITFGIVWLRQGTCDDILVLLTGLICGIGILASIVGLITGEDIFEM